MFSHESKILIEYLTKYSSSSLEPQMDEHQIRFDLFRKIEHSLHRLYSKKNEVVIKRNIISHNYSSTESIFFPVAVKEYIRQHFLSNEVEEYTVDTISLAVLLYKEKSHSQETFRTLALYLNAIIDVLMRDIDTAICQQIRLFLIPTLCRKYTAKTTAWDSESVNNAYSIPGKCGSILIYRFEELLKVCIHECIHVLNIDNIAKEKYILPMSDSSDRSYHDLNDPYQATHFFETKFLLTCHYFPVLFKEAYTETWATIIHLVLISCITEHRLTKLLVLERKFVCFQVAKILYVSGLKSWSSFMTVHTTSPHIEQKTSLFSYFMLRSALLWDLSWFFQTFSHIQFSKNSTDISTCYQHCMKIFESAIYAENIDYYMRKISKLPRKQFLFRTMRMTCVELCL